MEKGNTSVVRLHEIKWEMEALKNSPQVLAYKAYIAEANTLEEQIRNLVTEKNATVEYYSIVDDEQVKISPAVKTTYSPELEYVEKEWGDVFLTIAVDSKAMQASSKKEVVDYLETVKKETIYSRKTKVKSKDSSLDF